MRFGNGMPRPRATRRCVPVFRPSAEVLEGRVVLTAINLANIAGPPPGVVGVGPYGIQEVGTNSRVSTFSVAAVGDINGDGFQDFVIGAPTLSTAYLIFGSDAVTANGASQTVDWLTLQQNQRVGDLTQLGSPNQSNPSLAVGTGQYTYNGLTFTTGSNPASGLGTSVAAVGDVNNDGFNDLLIGAPGANGGIGEAYLVYGGRQLATRSLKSVDLDSGASDISIQRYSTTNTVALGPNPQIGGAVGLAGTFLADTRKAIVIGAPNASANGLTNNGAVFVIPNSVINPAPAGAATGFFDVARVGQNGTGSGVIFSGPNSGALAGAAVSDAGNIDQGIRGEDLLIGAPLANNTAVASPITGTGAAYLIYGNSSFTGGLVVNGLRTVPLSAVSQTNAGGAALGPTGATFFGGAAGDQTGFAVANAGDFDGDGFSDFLVGSPGANGTAGSVALIYGGTRNNAPPGQVVGSFTLNNLPGTLRNVRFDGTAAGDLAGFSVSAVGLLSNQARNGILIGSPGFGAGSGAVYVIPGTPTGNPLGGAQKLANVNGTGVAETLITDAGSAATTGAVQGLGFSVSGIIGQSGRGGTADGDRLADFAIGAEAFGLGSPRILSGSAYLLQGRFIPLANPTGGQASGISGIDGVFGNPPLTIPLTNPANTIQIFVNSSSGPPIFAPVTDINPQTLVINGIPAASFASVTVTPDTVDRNGDGIPDAIITVSPRSALNLVVGNNQNFTVSGRTRATAANPNAAFSFSTLVNVTNGSNNNGSGGLPSSGNVSTSFGLLRSNVAGSNIGERLVPLTNTLSPLIWKPLHLKYAFRQFLPSAAYQLRHQEALGKHVHGNHSNQGPGLLKHRVLDRSHFKLNTPIGVIIHHRAGRTVPATI